MIALLSPRITHKDTLNGHKDSLSSPKSKDPDHNKHNKKPKDETRYHQDTGDKMEYPKKNK